MLRRLRAERPGDAVLSEEAYDDLVRLRADRVWIIDPLDGTREFSTPGRDDWAVHIALWQRAQRDGEREITDAAVALPARGKGVPQRHGHRAPRARQSGPIRIAVSSNRPPAVLYRHAQTLAIQPVRIGSAGAKAMAVVAATSTPTSTPAANGSGIRPRRPGWCWPRACTPRGWTVRRCATTSPTRICPTSDVPRRGGRSCSAPSASMALTARGPRVDAMQSWPSAPVPAAARTRAGPAAVRQLRPPGPPGRARIDRHDVRLRHHALRRDAPGPRRHLSDLRPRLPAVAGQRARGALRPEHHRRRRSAVRARQPRRHRLARPRRPRDRAVPRGHGRAAGAAAARLRRRDRGDRRGGRARREDAGVRGGVRRRRASTRTSTTEPTPLRSSATSPATTATPCCGCSPSAAATRTAPARPTRSTPCCGGPPVPASRAGRRRSAPDGRAGTSSARRSRSAASAAASTFRAAAAI